MPELQNEPLTFEKVWAALMENREQMKETDRKIKETDRQIKETSRIVGRLGNRFGEVAEHMVAPGIAKKFNAFGFHFNDISRNREFKDPATQKSLAEVDVLLENGEIVIAVEVKVKLEKNDVDEHRERMERLRRRADSRGDNRTYRGAVAATVLTDKMRDYALASGFYVIEQNGEAMKLEIPEGFVPRDW
jgi:hypothetical protein